MELASSSPSPQDHAIVPWGWSERFRMPLYRPGTRVRHAGAWETVSHVALRRHDLTVYLVGRTEPVDPLSLELDPTLFTTRRVPQPT
ncbi:hypothetical protein SAMN05428957_101221 [Oryzisolibacter propanilivorax]|uniref:Uncharacterized protein n=1 Tax=Oryzisolibacter propanilivorax TaxID=1527607 RepID=A0A1G9P6B9_9BURK|nr:hypothetical protein [Oryzisolibacter propanilivorax]SDL94254.1 hypothetical protein SAMN05428957_101221 [Oryzisolibacter propanilivorax]